MIKIEFDISEAVYARDALNATLKRLHTDYVEKGGPSCAFKDIYEYALKAYQSSFDKLETAIKNYQTKTRLLVMAYHVREEDDEVPTDEKIKQQNEFFETLRTTWPENFGDDTEFSTYCLKATTNEMVDEVVRRLNPL